MTELRQFLYLLFSCISMRPNLHSLKYRDLVLIEFRIAGVIAVTIEYNTIVQY